jgi:hypothetical protein
MQQALLQNKVTRIYWIMEFTSLARGPESVVVPTPNAVSVAELLKGFVGRAPNGPQFVQDGDVVIGGQQALVDALLKKEGDVSSTLTTALASNRAPHGLVALTPVALTTALMASPAIKSWAGDDLAKVSALGEALAALKLVSLQTDLPPAHARLIIETQSAEAAQKAVDFANKAIQAGLPELAQQLTFSTDGPNIRLESDSLERSVAIFKTVQRLSGGSHQSVHMNNMKQIALALHNYMDAHGSMPPQALTDANGKRLLSWRVLILPYLEQSALYQQFHLDEPWDSEHNLEVAHAIPSVYHDVVPQLTPPRTRIVAPLTADSPFGRPGAPIHFRDVHDGTSNTIWLVQADKGHAVVWSKPEDATIDLQNPLSALIDADHGDQKVLIGRMDGSVQALSTESLAKWLIPMLTIQGGEVIPNQELK